MNFFKKLFSREPEDVTLKAIELKGWLEDISEDALSTTNKNIKKKFGEIEELKKELTKKLLELEDAGLVNPNIPDREKHIMTGNRIHYIQKATKFFEDVKEPEFDYLEIQDFCHNFEESLKNFDSATSKPYFILTNFFDKEMKEIAFIIKKIEDTIIQISKLTKSQDIREYKALLVKIRDLNEASLISEKLVNEINQFETELNNNKDKKIKIENRRISLKTSKDFTEFNKLELEKNEVEENISKLNSKLNNALKAIDKPLKKFMHGAIKKDLISDYLSHPLDALEKDKTYKILKILDKLSQEIKKGHIEVKDKLVPKINKQLKLITKPYLADIKKQFILLKEKKAEINKRVERLSVMMDFKELQYQLDHVTDKLSELKEKVSNKKEILTNLQLESKIKNLEKSLSEFTGKEVNIN